VLTTVFVRGQDGLQSSDPLVGLNLSPGGVTPNFETTLSAQDIELPPVRYTSFHGSFFVDINNKPVEVVYSLPREDNELAASASNLIFYGPHPNEHTDLTRNIVPDLVTKLGCSVFSLSFVADRKSLSSPKTAYWSDSSGWFSAVMGARNQLINAFKLKKRKLLLLGYSGGGGMVLNLAGAYPSDVEAVAAQGANLAPSITGYNPIKWLIVNNRGETNAAVTQPFFQTLKEYGCSALYCETTPSRAREHYHAPSQQAYDLIYAYLAGVLDQRKRSEDGLTTLAEQWPYAAPAEPLERYHVVRSNTLDAALLASGRFDLLPSAAFSVDWSKVCPPLQNVMMSNGTDSLHVNFPASSQPNGLVVYYDDPNYQEFAREFEDICALAEAGYVVISPTFRMPPEKFAHLASDWIVSNAKLQTLPIHLAAYGPSGARFLSSMRSVTDLSVKSVNLVSLSDFFVDPTVANNIEALAKDCGLYSFFLCRDAHSSSSLADLAQSLVDNQSRSRGCQEVVVNPNADKPGIGQKALTTVVQTIKDYDGNITVTSADLWLDPISSVSLTPIVNKRLNITVDVHDRGLYGKKSSVELKSLGVVLARQDLSFDYDGEQTVTLSYVPAETGEIEAQVVLLPLPEEASKNNNEVDIRFVVGNGH
jgi:pimeloyl-ACP methyl ester carboxylesterase